MKAKVAVTMGDPAGIGPEIVARVCNDPEIREIAEIVLIGRQMVLAAGALSANQAMPEVEIIECGPPAQIKPGQPSEQSGAQAAAFVKKAVELCLNGQVQAMVTAPISKEHLNAAGFHYSGHTDMLGDLAGGVRPVMLLAGSKLKVSLVTVHTSLQSVARQVNRESILHTSIITHQALQKYFAVARPRLAVCALNPHAGENGLLGDEEGRIIAPAVAELRNHGIDARGPLSADSLFWEVLRYQQYDAVICMYHDQGLIPFKIAHFADGVNVSLGLPFIRTSPDHGTAFHLAGKGQASASSMKEAVKLAVQMAQKAA